MRLLSRRRVALTAVALQWASWSLAAVCSVPSAPYPTIQSAVDDATCAEVVLAPGIFAESVTVSRNLRLSGASNGTTVIEGQLTVQGGSTEVDLEDLTIDSSVAGVAGVHGEALRVEGGAEVIGADIIARNAVFDPLAVFSDGFESGDTSEWSATIP